MIAESEEISAEQPCRHASSPENLNGPPRHWAERPIVARAFVPILENGRVCWLRTRADFRFNNSPQVFPSASRREKRREQVAIFTPTPAPCRRCKKLLDDPAGLNQDSLSRVQLYEFHPDFFVTVWPTPAAHKIFPDHG